MEDMMWVGHSDRISIRSQGGHWKHILIPVVNNQVKITYHKKPLLLGYNSATTELPVAPLMYVLFLGRGGHGAGGWDLTSETF